jgi:hypothetical protein
MRNSQGTFHLWMRIVNSSVRFLPMKKKKKKKTLSKKRMHDYLFNEHVLVFLN